MKPVYPQQVSLHAKDDGRDDSKFQQVLDRLNAIEGRLSKIERVTLPLTPLGPQKPTLEQEAEKARVLTKQFLGLKEKIEAAKEVLPVDRSARELVSGKPVPEDYSHTEDRGDGQQKDYVVLTKEERSKGFVRPYRDAYRHLKCGKITTMGRAIAETLARDPEFYLGGMCVHCGSHFPNEEFVWYEMDGTTGPKVGT
jgi:hypothetical protein